MPKWNADEGRAINDQELTTCQRCGTCCTKGGPALHADDLPLIQDHRLDFSDLITIRLGEPVFSPLVNKIEPSRTELIKVSGQNDSWTCRFFSPKENGCEIYRHRPLECRLLQCWAPSALTSVIYQECLTRKAIMPVDDELAALVDLQEEHCSFASLAKLRVQFAESGAAEPLMEIGRIINLDLRIRQRAIKARGVQLAEELLFFGRPLFKSLAFYQLTLREGPQGLRVIPPPSTA